MSEHIRKTDMPDDEELILLRRRLDQHVHECDARNSEQDLKIERLILAQEATTKSVDTLVISTQGLVDSWKFTQALRKFVVWVSVFTVPAGAVYTKFKGIW